jgi:hypothetical protein
MERNKHRQRAYHLRRRHHRDSSKLPWFGSIASREEEWQADKQTGEEVVVVVCAVAKQAMMHRHVAEALPPPSLATSYRFCFLPCRRDPSSATKEPDAPPNLNNAPTTDDSLGLQTDRQRRERERDTDQARERRRHVDEWMQRDGIARKNDDASDRASACTQTENTVHSSQIYPGSRGRKNRRELRDGLRIASPRSHNKQNKRDAVSAKKEC